MLANASAAPADRLATLPPWPWDPLDAKAPMTLGYEAVRWAERGLIQPNGPRAGQKFRYTHDQFVFLLWAYAMDADGQWLFNHLVRRLAKGSGKSPSAALFALTEFLAPVRLARKDSRLPGGCAGHPVQMPWVQIAATAESQTANTMRMVRAFAPKGSAVVNEYGIDIGKTRFYVQPEGTLEVITSSMTAAEGAEASAVVGDQTELWVPSNGGPAFAATLADNLAKSGQRMLETPNAWVPGLDSVAEATWDAWLAQEEGRLRGDSKILYDARMAPPDTDLTDYASLESALRFNYADCDWKAGPDGEIDVRSIIERIWSPMSQVSESKRKYLNWPTVANDAWVTPQELAVLVDSERVVTKDEHIVLFFDGSTSSDATGIVAACISDGHVFVPPAPTSNGFAVWEPLANDTVVPVNEVDASVAILFETFNVCAFFADVREWESFVKTSWPAAHGDKLAMWAVPHGKDPQRIAWDMRGHVFEFTRAAELFLSEVRERKFTYDGNPVLTRHLTNCRNRPGRYGVSVGKESPGSPHKIDLAVCAIGARMVRQQMIASGNLPKPKSGKTRKVLVL